MSIEFSLCCGHIIFVDKGPHTPPTGERGGTFNELQGTQKSHHAFLCRLPAGNYTPFRGFQRINIFFGRGQQLWARIERGQCRSRLRTGFVLAKRCLLASGIGACVKRLTADSWREQAMSYLIPNEDAQPECLCHGDLSQTMGSGRSAFSTGNSSKTATQPERTKSLFRYSSKRGLQDIAPQHPPYEE